MPFLPSPSPEQASATSRGSSLMEETVQTVASQVKPTSIPFRTLLRYSAQTFPQL